MEYYEVQVLFEEEVTSKSGIKLRKVRRNNIVNAKSVTASEAMVYKWLTDSPYSYEVISSKKSKIVDVVSD